jgi:hypothetical protein
MILDKIVSFNSIIWLILSIFFSPILNAEESVSHDDPPFYALSSLKFFLEETLANKAHQDYRLDKIDFKEQEVARLWLLASSHPSLFSRIKDAQSYYDEACRHHTHSQLFTELCQKSHAIVEHLWQELNPYIQKDVLFEHPLRGYDQRYPHFDNNPYMTEVMRRKMRPYLLPLESPLRNPLEAIFTASRAIQNEATFIEAGFITIAHQHNSMIRVARHTAFPGYLFKVYLDSDSPLIQEIDGWERLRRRCKGAKNIRRLIKEKQLVHFSVPDKWLYPLPFSHIPSTTSRKSIQPVLLIVTDMNLVSAEESVEAWRSQVTRSHLDELYCILSHGFASTYLPYNIPYTKSGKFACIDTEYPKRKIRYQSIKKYLSPEMQVYWDELVKRGESPKHSK